LVEISGVGALVLGMKKLSEEVRNQIVMYTLEALGDGDAQVQVTDTSIVVTCLVGKAVFGEIRVDFSDFERGFWEIRQSVTLWSHRVSAHNVNELASVLVDVGARVRNAEIQVDAYMRGLPSTRISSHYEPIVL
jgi:hypothetical protein